MVHLVRWAQTNWPDHTTGVNCRSTPPQSPEAQTRVVYSGGRCEHDPGQAIAVAAENVSHDHALPLWELDDAAFVGCSPEPDHDCRRPVSVPSMTITRKGRTTRRDYSCEL